MVTPLIEHIEKSTPSKTNRTADHTTFGKYNVNAEAPIGKTQAATTKMSNKENTALMNGTKMQFNKSDQTDM